MSPVSFVIPGEVVLMTRHIVCCRYDEHQVFIGRHLNSEKLLQMRSRVIVRVTQIGSACRKSREISVWVKYLIFRTNGRFNSALPRQCIHLCL